MKFKIFLLMTLGLLLGQKFVLAEDNEVCLSCHGQHVVGIPFVDIKDFAKSIHGKNLCISCHDDAREISHPVKLTPVSCRNCHRIESTIYLRSDHGKAMSQGMTEAATCTSCHGKTHTLLPSRNPDSPVNRKNIPQTCATCHANKEKMSKIRLSEKEPFDTYLHSVHGEAIKSGKLNAAVCSDCHGTHDLHGASNPQSKMFRHHIPDTCGKCHENVKGVYERSVHGKALKAGLKEVPVCTDCHGEHTIRSIKDPASTVYAGAITKMCSSCHESERILTKFGLPTDRLKTYRDSYHGLAGRLGDIRAANCASCHGWHDILPSYDTQSSIHPKNLNKTCGKCHAGAQVQRIIGRIHGGEEPEEHGLIRLITLIYLILIPLIIGGMAFFIFFDYLRKALSPLLGRVPHSLHDEMLLRLNLQERIKHAVLTQTFLVLAYSGFSLKYSDAWWAYPFQLGSESLRKGIHRWTALFFCLNGLWHLLYMAFSRRGRFILRRHFLPKFADIHAFLGTFAYNIGVKRVKPSLSYPSFIERVEYWSLLWGSLIMIVTGSILVFNDLMLKYFPLWVSNLATLIHLYEAVLACLAILVWHMYWGIFDPDVYPMNWAWLTGRLRFRKKDHDSA